MQRDQKLFSKKPAICGALKLTKKLRECLSRQLCCHLLSSRTIERSDRLHSAEPLAEFELCSFTLQSEDIASLQPGLLGSQGTPRIRQGMQPVVIIVPFPTKLPLSLLLYSASDSLHQFTPLSSFASSTLLVLLIPPRDVRKGFLLSCSSSSISESTMFSSGDWEDEADVHDRASAHGPLAKG
jgi:hypothetical protein